MTPTAPEGFTQVDEAITQGIPHAIELNQGTRVVLVVPTGLAQTWRDADPSLVVSQSDPELVGSSGQPDTVIGDASRASARIVVQFGGVTMASLPLCCGLRRMIPDDGQPQGGIKIELTIVSWTIYAGSMRGVGDFGSRISLAWRRADQALSHYSTPLPNPYFVKRVPPILIMKDGSKKIYHLESTVGLALTVPVGRFQLKKLVVQ
jgi:hypothetical protein